MPTLADQVRAIAAEDEFLRAFDVAVQVSARRKYIAWAIAPGAAGITIAVPAGKDPEEVRRVLVAERARLARHVAQERGTVPPQPAKVLRDGESFLWLGREVRLCLVGGEGPAAGERAAADGWLTVSRHAVELRGAQPVIDWYVREGTAWAVAEAAQWWPRMSSGRLPDVRVADIGRSRWGKYDPRAHRVSVSWRAVQLPYVLASHVLLHELTHATRPAGTSHSSCFWHAFDRVRPGAREEQRRLHRQGSVWMGDVAGE